MKNKKGKPFEITVKHDINIFLYAIIKNIHVYSLEFCCILSIISFGNARSSLFRFIEDISSTCANISVTKKYAYYILTRGTLYLQMITPLRKYINSNIFSI